MCLLLAQGKLSDLLMWQADEAALHQRMAAERRKQEEQVLRGA